MRFEEQLERVIIKAYCINCNKYLEISVGSIREATSDFSEEEICECGNGSLKIIGVVYETFEEN